jgi:inner membrane protein
VGKDFRARYQVGNLALGTSLIGDVSPRAVRQAGHPDQEGPQAREAAPPPMAQIDLIQPVDLYAQIGRAAKYGFLFIGFTFLALLLFDIVGGAQVRAAEYLLVGVGLVLFFVLLLAFAEVIGFAPAYLLASAAITAYSAAVLKSWRRALAVAALMVALYGVLYLLLSLEAYSLLIGALLLFATLAAVMYLTRNLNWGGAAGSGIEHREEVPAH